MDPLTPISFNESKEAPKEELTKSPCPHPIIVPVNRTTRRSAQYKKQFKDIQYHFMCQRCHAMFLRDIREVPAKPEEKE